jgi:hypothetical protein
MENNRLALLIGFQYNTTISNLKKLPGITVDLYQVYNFLKNIGWKNEEIYILTDMNKDEKTDVLKTAILEKTVGVEILSFIEDIKNLNQHIEIKSHNYQNNFLKNINQIFENANHRYIFVYYTGHFKEGNIILPDNSFINLENFVSNFLNFSQISDYHNLEKEKQRETEKEKQREILLIMDCCECKNIFPFELNDKVFRLKFNNSKIKFYKNRIICISSSLENENSITSKSGSYFTKILVQILNNRNQSLSDIMKKLKENKYIDQSQQTPNISVTFPNIYMLPGWLYSSYLSLSFFPSYIEISKN